jgi:3-isopropylmalate dehydrogenase
MVTDITSDTRTVLLLPGDGIGPEVVAQAQRVIALISQRYNTPIALTTGLIGGCATEATGTPLPPATLALAQQAHAIVLGAVGGPQYDRLPVPQRPEQGLLAIRQALSLYANLRPVQLIESLLHASPLKPERLARVDMVIVRELTGGAYFGTPRELSDTEARDSIVYTRTEIERIAHVAFKLAKQRRGQLCSVDKANVLATSRLWRTIVTELGQAHYPDVAVTHMYVDNAAMQLMARPGQFDVMLTENMFGDILSDEASMLAASLGMLPSASLGTTTHTFGTMGLYEPCHGSAPDIAGQNKANPVGTLLSVAMMLRHSLAMPQAALALEQAVTEVLATHRTADIAEPGQQTVSTTDFGQAVIDALAYTQAGWVS